jgi:hypothetical protein
LRLQEERERERDDDDDEGLTSVVWISLSVGVSTPQHHVRYVLILLPPQPMRKICHTMTSDWIASSLTSIPAYSAEYGGILPMSYLRQG